MLKLGKVRKRIRENHKIDLICSDALIEEIGRCTEGKGARNVDILTARCYRRSRASCSRASRRDRKPKPSGERRRMATSYILELSGSCCRLCLGLNTTAKAQAVPCALHGGSICLEDLEEIAIYISKQTGTNELLLESFTGSEGSQLFCLARASSENKRIV